LAVILDLFSRKVVGWKLGETVEAELVETALGNALMMRRPDPGLYFHSDRGSQYSSQNTIASGVRRKPVNPTIRNVSALGTNTLGYFERVAMGQSRPKHGNMGFCGDDLALYSLYCYASASVRRAQLSDYFS
jgi:hypothetical protein